MTACVGDYVPPANRRCRKRRGSTVLVSTTTPVTYTREDSGAGWRKCVLPAYHWCDPKVMAKDPCEPSVWASVREILALGGQLGIALGRLGYAECVR